MSDAVYTEQHVFDSGPPLRLQQSLGLVKPDQPRTAMRALAGAFLAWTPLAVLAIVQSLLTGDGSARWFFSDFSVHARYLVALPALILAEIDCIPRLEKIVVQFLEVGLITDEDRPRFRAAIDSSRHLLDSRYADVLVPVIAYVCVIAVTSLVPFDLVPQWQRGVSSHYWLAGWWHVLFSFPLLLILLLGWLWRLLVWGRFLILVAALHLKLLPSHPDCAGGLQFVSTSLRGFRLISFALSAIVAGSIADWVVYHDMSLMSFKFHVLILGGFLLLLQVGPLTVFIARLRQAKIQGMFTYGALANHMGREFEAKWIKSHQAVDSEILEKPDFSATTDYFGVAANVYQMRELPFSIKDVVTPLLPACVPFLFVALLKVPFQVIFESAIKLVL